MNQKILRVILVANLQKDGAELLLEEISTYLKNLDIEVHVFSYYGKAEIPSLESADLVFSLGGDGTVLFCSRIVESMSIPILAVNIGDFGFITEISKNEWKSSFIKYQKGQLDLSRRVMLKVMVERDGASVAFHKGLNDAVITSNGISNIVKLNLHINDTDLGKYKADGIIVATPTGSTAYSISAGGPILDPEMEALIINPICPFTLSNRPIVVSGNEVIHITIDTGQRTDVILSVDGQDAYPLLEGDKVIIERSQTKALLIRSDQRNFYDILRSKLNWSGGVNA
ncbi:MAG: NAD(+)/NADH kinase [Spirochaetaceae bacterium]|nr:NAD(+)/NADH kinase [Spirochaetaceae bacterium]